MEGTGNLVALAMLGLVLSIALAGEMLRLSVKPDAAAAWFVFAGLVLFGAQIFSDILGRAVARRSEATGSELINIGVRDLWVLTGPFVFALLLLGAHAIGIEPDAALISAIAAALVFVGSLTFYAAAAYRTWPRVFLAVIVVTFCALIVFAENIV